MFARWLHKTWKYFWTIILTLLLVVVIIAGGVLGLLQLEVTQDYITDRIEQQVEQTYKAQLSIGELNGFLPFNLSMHDVVLSRADTVSRDTLASVETIDSQIDVWGLLQNDLTITGFSMNRPRVWLQSDEEGRRQFLIPRESTKQSDKQYEDTWFSRIEIVAPEMEISNGAVFLASATTENKIGNLPQRFSLQDINTTFFVDWSEQQRFLDIESFSAETNDLNIEDLSFSGQVYSDDRLLEFNSFYVNLGNSRFILNGDIEGVNLLEPGFTSQLLQASYNLEVQSDRLYPRDLRDLFGNMPSPKTAFTIDIVAEGTMESLQVDNVSLGLGKSRLSFNGLIKNLHKREEFSYDVRLAQLNLQKQNMDTLFGDAFVPSQYRAVENVRGSGYVAGNLDSVDVDLQLKSPSGQLTLKGQSRFNPPYQYDGVISGTNIDLGGFAPAHFDTTSLSFEADLEGLGLNLEKGEGKLQALFYDSHINNIHFEQLELSSTLANGNLQSEYNYRRRNKRIDGSGNIGFSQGQASSLSMRGNAENIDLTTFWAKSGVSQTNLNFDYNIKLRDLHPSDLNGRANLDIKPSVVGDDTVRAHQLYMDLNGPDVENRTFRLTSSLMDMNLTGDIAPRDIIDQSQFWSAYLFNRFKSEILMDSAAVQPLTLTSIPEEPVVVEGNITAKDLSLIKTYFPQFPHIQTDSEITFSANTDGNRLLFSAEMQADSLHYNQLEFTDSRTQMTANFRSDRTLKEFSTVDFEANVGTMITPSVDIDSMGIDLAVKKDSINYTQHARQISDNARFQLAIESSLSDSLISVSVPDFFMGNEQYAWVNQNVPSFNYKRSGEIEFNNFSFQNRNEFFGLQGTLSRSRSDSLTYILRDINLERISELIKGKINFAGILNGTVTTRSLTSQPTVQGELAVNRFQLDDRLVGDVTFNSQFNPDRDRFDTQINVITDSTKYGEYLDKNDDIGQNIRLDGYFVTPEPDVQQDSVFYFDTEFNQIDMWVLPLFLDNIFMDMEGQASGEGYISGSFEDIDFHADFETENVFAKPQFVNTNYFVNGPVSVDRHEGVVLDSVNIMDTKGGTGVVWGTVDLNDFKPVTYLDLTLEMDELQFLNNNMDPDVPFYGNVSGSGRVRLTGANNDMYMRTNEPIQVTSDSKISIPLLEETELSETGKFIQFVDSFEQKEEFPDAQNEGPNQEQISEEQLEEQIRGMTFSERFDLDLQFNASQDLTVELIFDPVTGEILTAQGNGQLRITMQDQDVQMFGRYNITSGNYQFVTGEIISRRLELESGGTIIWEGPPDNARLDISAVYNARPNISTLTSEAAIESQNENGGQRVPVELIVEINGTLKSVENNYYFRLPSSLDLSSNSTLSYTINQINRDEQQKLLQATSILFTGQFIPTQGTGSPTASLSQSLTRGSTVLNPLISNQVISPLLSNQINALLNSDVSRFDVDFNLNAYNEVDLGIALRLYNDRLILRREGQITGGGPESTLGDRIGDLNATYRIQRGLSLTAFHRQDQVLNNVARGSRTGDVTPSVDGLGLESQIRYNSWKELWGNVKDVFKSIFGISGE